MKLIHNTDILLLPHFGRGGKRVCFCSTQRADKSNINFCLELRFWPFDKLRVIRRIYNCNYNVQYSYMAL